MPVCPPNGVNKALTPTQVEPLNTDITTPLPTLILDCKAKNNNTLLDDADGVIA